MKNIVQLIREHRFTEAEEQIDNAVPLIMEKKFLEIKKSVAAKICEQMGIKTASEKVRSGIMEDELEEEITSNLKDADNLQVKNMQKVFGKPGAIKRIMSPVAKDPKFTKDQNKNPQGSFGVSDEKQDRGLPSSSDSLVNSNKDFLRRSTPSKDLKEEEQEEEIDEARINIVRARIRGGKIQRRKRVSNVAGMTLRGGTLKRMSAAERRRRKLGARKGKMKRRAKLSRSLMKRKRSLQKRKSLGL